MYTRSNLRGHPGRKRLVAGIAAAVFVGSVTTAVAQALPGDKIGLLASAAPPGPTPGPACQANDPASECRLAGSTLVGPVYIFLRSQSGNISKVRFFCDNTTGAGDPIGEATTNPFVLSPVQGAACGPPKAAASNQPTGGANTGSRAGGTNINRANLNSADQIAAPGVGVNSGAGVGTNPGTLQTGTLQNRGIPQGNGTGTAAGGAPLSNIAPVGGVPVAATGFGNSLPTGQATTRNATGTVPAAAATGAAALAAFNTAVLPDGPHNIVAEITTKAGGKKDLLAQFTVQNGAGTQSAAGLAQPLNAAAAPGFATAPQAFAPVATGVPAFGTTPFVPNVGSAVAPVATGVPLYSAPAQQGFGTVPVSGTGPPIANTAVTGQGAPAPY